MKDYTKTKRITTAHHNVKSKICKAPKRATWPYGPVLQHRVVKKQVCLKEKYEPTCFLYEKH